MKKRVKQKKGFAKKRLNGKGFDSFLCVVFVFVVLLFVFVFVFDVENKWECEKKK
jgi:hypothetical protein